MTMAGLLLAFRLVLAVVFAAAGAAKLSRPAVSRETAVQFGLPRRLAFVAIAIPVAELAVAALLLPSRPAWPAGSLRSRCWRSSPRRSQPSSRVGGALRATASAPFTRSRSAR